MITPSVSPNGKQIVNPCETLCSIASDECDPRVEFRVSSEIEIEEIEIEREIEREREREKEINVCHRTVEAAMRLSIQ